MNILYILENNFKWGSINDGYVQFIKSQGHCASSIVVVFDSLHRRQQKQFCNKMKRSREKYHIQQKKNSRPGSNKTELISKLVEELHNARTLTVRYRDDADTDVTKQSVEHSLKGIVEVRTEDAAILIMLTHHYHPDKHHLITVLLKW